MYCLFRVQVYSGNFAFTFRAVICHVCCKMRLEGASLITMRLHVRMRIHGKEGKEAGRRQFKLASRPPSYRRFFGGIIYRSDSGLVIDASTF